MILITTQRLAMGILALSLPDICGKIDNPGESSQKRYEAWINDLKKTLKH